MKMDFSADKRSLSITVSSLSLNDWLSISDIFTAKAAFALDRLATMTASLSSLPAISTMRVPDAALA